MKWKYLKNIAKPERDLGEGLSFPKQDDKVMAVCPFAATVKLFPHSYGSPRPLPSFALNVQNKRPCFSWGTVHEASTCRWQKVLPRVRTDLFLLFFLTPTRHAQ